MVVVGSVEVASLPVVCSGMAMSRLRSTTVVVVAYIDAPAGCMRSMIAMHFVNFQLDQPGYIKLQPAGHIYTPSVSSLARVI